MDAQTKAFQALKPICVALGETAKSLSEGKATISKATSHLESLKRTLTSHTKKPGALHPKLAEYVFFPISQVLRVSQKASIQCLELCLQCISILIDQGWQQHLPAQTAAQLVILCTLLADKKPQGLPFAETTEELQASAFWCLYHIFTFAGENKETKRLLTTEAHFPQLGKTISVTLDAIEDSARGISQAAASTALEALLINVADREVHASFLPGIVSKLTKTLTPSTKSRTSPHVLTRCLNIVQMLLKSTLGKSDDSSSRSDVASLGASSNTSIVDVKWQETASTQLKPALASILRLRSHSNREVTLVLGGLCLTILRACRETLANCRTITLETLVVISASDRDSSLSIEFEMLLQADVSIASSLQDLLYVWLQSLPTTMQGADEQAKLQRMRQISSSYQLLAQAGTHMSEIERAAASALRDSVVVTLTLPGAPQQAISPSAPLQPLDLALLGDERESAEFESPLVKYKGQQDIMRAIESFTITIADHSSSAELRSATARSLRQTEGDGIIANFWLLLTASERSFQRQSEENSLFDIPGQSSGASTEELEELYSFALTVLTDQDDETQDPRLKALALRALALRARSEGQDFRFELLDALYPVLHTLATPDDMLQRASITTLNILTSTCGYASVKDLIVDNVDYLTNAVALKLNAFDVSPQAPQVLLMMLRLAGPTLLPYLEDTVESIFGALEDYHGYPLLVELLFRVLGVIAEEGVKAPQLAIEAAKSGASEDELADSWASTTVLGLATQLRLRAQNEIGKRKSETTTREQHPERPWGDRPDSARADEADDVTEPDQNQALDSAEPGPPAPRTYGLLLKITELTQHFLASASSSLRTSLLGLIRTTAPALSQHENSFLPLINTLWPEIVARLDDEEAHIMVTALDIVRVLCECAGDFMRTRIVQLWPRLVEIHRDVARDITSSESLPHRSAKSDCTMGADLVVSGARLKQALSRMANAPSDYGDTSAKLLWSALQALIPAIVQHVHMPPELMDEALEMVTPMLSKQKVRSAFEEDNGDALWLALFKSGAIDRPEPPVVPSDRDWNFAAVAG